MAKKTSRMGGRAARQALRAAPIPEEEKPVRPGLQSGRYQPLTQEEVERIHEAALQTLETIGFANRVKHPLMQMPLEAALLALEMCR